MSIADFASGELILIYLYAPSRCVGVPYKLRDMLRNFMPDERQLMHLTESAIAKPEKMTNEGYEALSETLMPFPQRGH